MTYDLRRLRLRRLIEGIPFTRRYRVTDHGLRTALCYHRTYARVLRPAMSVASTPRRVRPPASTAPSNRSIGKYGDYGRDTTSPPECNPTVNINPAQGI